MSPYRIETWTGLAAPEWSRVLATFRDSNLFQTQGLGLSSPRGTVLEHWILYDHDAPVAATQVQIVNSLTGPQALVRRGPLWRPIGKRDNSQALVQLLEHIGHAYAGRSWALTVVPKCYASDHPGLDERLEQIGYRRIRVGMDSFLLDLDRAPEEIRAKLRKNWHRHLRRAEREGLDIVSGTTGDLFDIFLDLYREMRARKSITSEDDVWGLRGAQMQVLPSERMWVFVAFARKRPVAAIVVSALGEAAESILGASSIEGRQLCASFLLEWQVIRWLQEKSYRTYDLGGVHLTKNPGVFRYKEGLGGRKVQYMGEYSYVEVASGGKVKTT